MLLPAEATPRNDETSPLAWGNQAKSAIQKRPKKKNLGQILAASEARPEDSEILPLFLVDQAKATIQKRRKRKNQGQILAPLNFAQDWPGAKNKGVGGDFFCTLGCFIPLY